MNTYSHIQQDQIAAAFEKGKVTWHSGGLPSVLKHIKQSILLRWKRYRLNEKLRSERMQLMTLSDEQLADIGITRAAALQEGRRAWGDVPADRQV